MTIILPFLLMILHFSHIFFTLGLSFIFFYTGPFFTRILFCSPGYTTLCKVIYRNFYCYLIARYYPDVVHSELTGYVSVYGMPVGQLYLEGRIGQCLKYCSFKFNNVVLWQNIHSFFFSQGLFMIRSFPKPVLPRYCQSSVFFCAVAKHGCPPSDCPMGLRRFFSLTCFSSFSLQSQLSQSQLRTPRHTYRVWRLLCLFRSQRVRYSLFYKSRRYYAVIRYYVRMLIMSG